MINLGYKVTPDIERKRFREGASLVNLMTTHLDSSIRNFHLDDQINRLLYSFLYLALYQFLRAIRVHRELYFHLGVGERR